MDDTTRDDYFRLLALFGVQTHGLGELLRDGGSPAAALAADDARLAQLPPATQKLLTLARHPNKPDQIRERLLHERQLQERLVRERLIRERLEFLPLHDPRYPQALRDIPDPPPWLFARGDLGCLTRPSVAMVGSRRASHAGLRAATEIAELLAAAGYTVCSGLALGIDAAAHRGALRAGSTAAVLASGIDRASPRQHRGLLAEIEQRGCVVSELPPGTSPSRWQFPRRNRIISGLASATIIVEAALPSGSLNTATAALEQGREVFTLPWSIYHARGAGCLYLLRDGATPITALDELADRFPGVSATADGGAPEMQDCVSAAAETLFNFLGDSAMSLELLGRSTGIDSASLLVQLGELELAGRVRCVDGTYLRADHKSCQQKASC
jgi:DNA processing protein